MRFSTSVPNAANNPPRPVQTMDLRLEKMEKMVSKALAEGNYDPAEPSAVSNLSLSPSGSSSLPFLSPEQVPAVNEADLSSSDEEAGAVQLSYDMQKLAVDATLQRFFGKSSGAVLLRTAMDVKNKLAKNDEAGIIPKVFGVKRPEYWTASPVSTFVLHVDICLHSSKWVRAKIQSAKSNYEFPEEDLMWTLIDLYFKYINTLLPLLHQQTFEGQVTDELHLRDGGFGGVLLLVCALGARFSDDPRVLLTGTDEVQSAGWAWYDQVQLFRNSGLAPPGIHEIQSYSVSEPVHFQSVRSSDHEP